MSYIGLLTELVTYWPPGQPNVHGKQDQGDPVEILVRWQDKIQKAIDGAGEEFLSNAVVYSSIPLSWKGWLARAPMAALEFPDAPRQNDNAFMVRVAGRSQNPQGIIVVYKNTL